MLNALRKAAGSWVAKILFILLIISFAAWGIGDFLQPSPETAVAEVGDSEISPEEYRREFNRELDRLRARLGSSLTQDLAIQLGLADQVLSQLVERRLLGIEARDLGVRISDDVVLDWIRSQEFFQDAAGQFDKRRFEEMVQANSLTEEGFIALVRGDIAREQVMNAVTSGAVAPAGLAETLYRHRQEQRVAELAFLPNDAAGAVPEPTDADIAAWYEGNKDRYRAPEYRSVTAALLRPDDVAAEIQIADDRLREAYENRIAEFQTPETREVSQLLFADEATAREAYEKIKGGAGFDAVAAEATGAQRTDIGAVKRGDLFPENVEAAAFGLPGPDVTDPVQSPLGWHVLNVGSVTPGATRPFEEVRDQLHLDLASEEAVEALIELSNGLEDALAGGASLEEAAGQVGAKLVRIPAVDRTGKDEAGLAVADLPPAPEFLDAAFETGEGELSRLTETPNGGLFILRVDSVKPSQVRPLDAVRDRVAAEWRTDQARKQAHAAAEKLAEQARTGEPLAAVAQSAGQQVSTSQPFTRQTNQPASRLPGPLVEKLFAAAPNDIVVEKMADGVVIARLMEVKAADPAADAERVTALAEDIERGMSDDILSQYESALRDRHGVTVNSDALQRQF